MRMILNKLRGSFFLRASPLGWRVGEASGNFVPFSGIYRTILLYKRLQILGFIPNLYVNSLVTPKIYTKKPGATPALNPNITLLF